MGSVKENEQAKLLKLRIVYEKDVFGSEDIYETVISNLLEDSKYIALSIRFPFQDYYEIELPKKYNNWQLRCAEELYTLIGKLNVKSYAENGISWTKDSGNISDALKEEIIPCVGVINNE